MTVFAEGENAAVWVVVGWPVARVTVTRAAFGLPRGRVVGERVQMELTGAPVQARVMVPERLAGVERRRGKVAFVPLVTLRDVGPSAARAKSTAVPARGTVCRPARGEVWEAGALSTMVRAPLRGPLAVGEKTTATVQAVPGASATEQVLPVAARAKSPVRVMLSMRRGRPPLLVRVRSCGAEVAVTPVSGKVTVVAGRSEMPGGAMAVPERATVWVR